MINFITPTRALSAIKSDYATVPYPAPTVSGADDTPPVGNQMIDSTKDFVALGVRAGNIIYNTSPGVKAAATVIADPLAASPDTLELNAAIFTGAGDDYIVYQAGPVTGNVNQGCALYVGTGGTLVITTKGGDIVTMLNVPDGTLIPVLVTKIWNATTASDILALW